MTRLEALVGLNLVGEIGGIRLNKLLRYCGGHEDILKSPCAKLAGIFGIGERIAQKIRSIKLQDIDREFSLAGELGLKIVTLEDAVYPQNLKEIPDPPIVLYVLGQLQKDDSDSLAIVGSRRASFYGLSCAEKFAGDLSAYGITVVSGMARGIDTSAHKGALKAGGRTIAVIGSGFKHIYPPENKGLAGQIAGSGAVISEFPMDARPLPQNFPRRNRIISGLSKGVLVVEAARNSGALITADFALEQGRDVFALPGKVDSGTSLGTNGLIQQGAKLVSCVEDIVEEFAPYLRFLRVKNEEALPKEALRNRLKDLSLEESALYELIAKDPTPLDEISEKSQLDIPVISELVLRLQITGLIRQLPGQQFIRN
ncbi:DNA-processing protein DprA [Candidatus Omnitrophota bacterium]